MTTQATSPREYFAQLHGITSLDVIRLRRLIDRHAVQDTHASNGDPHATISSTDKEANAKAWTISSNITAQKLDKLAKSLGFDGVDFNSSLYPTLVKDGDRFIIVPD